MLVRLGLAALGYTALGVPQRQRFFLVATKTSGPIEVRDALLAQKSAAVSVLPLP
jgi:hypothetical protein